jgi:hypothetical protein
VGEALDALPNQDVAWLQSALLRLGFDLGRIDGVMGDGSRSAMSEASIQMIRADLRPRGRKRNFRPNIESFSGQSHY